ncbi:MAG TPA: TatD family hydrolase [Anaerolineae bacterium]
MFFDTHCHLDVHEFDVDRAAVLERAAAARVTRILNPAYDIESSRRALTLAQQNDHVIAAVGIHPDNLAAMNEESLAQLWILAKQPKVVAIGEIGLDYHWNTFSHEIQHAWFVQQLNMAQQLNLPVIIHCREGYDDMLDILSTVQPRVGILLHSFAGDIAQAERALKMGCMFGIGGPVTYKNADELRRVVAQTPLERTVLETDAPYLPPHPYRGKRNEPGFLPLTADRLAALHNMSIEEVAHTTTANAIRFFGLT